LKFILFVFVLQCKVTMKKCRKNELGFINAFGSLKIKS